MTIDNIVNFCLYCLDKIHLQLIQLFFKEVIMFRFIRALWRGLWVVFAYVAAPFVGLVMAVCLKNKKAAFTFGVPLWIANIVLTIREGGSTLTVIAGIAAGLFLITTVAMLLMDEMAREKRDGRARTLKSRLNEVQDSLTSRVLED